MKAEPPGAATEVRDEPARKRKAEDDGLGEGEERSRRKPRLADDRDPAAALALPIPLPVSAGVVDVIFPEFRWEDVTWGNTGFILNELFFPVHRVFWRVATARGP
ncbi:MAG: hypothetical protein BJ554DRAFT_311 [Olpidium bornovanus]|uniref:Uncharacterized protein n=1 Tax=Olpidium bornovanus TaxID=278681 RepID=A0A8H8DLU9_9FUNG|nr:MAG: hypothetical protein BJ554DRAFT_311 [Olpidium bornovanus]